MLNFNTPIIDTKEYSEIKISEIEPILKINLRGKNRDFVTKIGKELSIITPVDPNTSSSNEKLNLLWLSPDEWFLYSNDKIELNDANFELYAANHYSNSACLGIEDFKEDLQRFKYINRLLRKYDKSGIISERLILNHIITIYNDFERPAATTMIFYRTETKHSKYVFALTFFTK